MATRRYKINPGEFDANGSQITEEAGAAVNSKGIELTVELAASFKYNAAGVLVALSKQDVLLALDELKAHIINGQWPPA